MRGNCTFLLEPRCSLQLVVSLRRLGRDWDPQGQSIPYGKCRQKTQPTGATAPGTSGGSNQKNALDKSRESLSQSPVRFQNSIITDSICPTGVTLKIKQGSKKKKIKQGSDGSAVKNTHANAFQSRRHGFVPGSGRSLGEGNSNPLQYSCLGNPMDRGAWWATVRGEVESDTTEWLNSNLNYSISQSL